MLPDPQPHVQVSRERFHTRVLNPKEMRPELALAKGSRSVRQTPQVNNPRDPSFNSAPQGPGFPLAS